MLSIFPALLSLELLAPFLLRVTLGAFLAWNSYTILKTGTMHMPERMRSVGRIITVLYGMSGVLLVVGLFTQLAALVVAILTALMLVYVVASRSPEHAHTHRMPLVFVLAISVSLIFLGAGFYAIDLPL